MTDQRTEQYFKKSVRYVAYVATKPCLFDGSAGYNVSIIAANPTIKVTEPRTWMCLICGWIYDESAGDEAHGIAPGTPWELIPMNWTCPECGARKEDFEMIEI